jgi:hypothetical protein
MSESIKDLINSGALKNGTELIWNRNREVSQAISPFWLSIVEALGSIKFEDSVYEE